MNINTDDTRTNIINLLKINDKMTINEVSTQLDMSSMGVRQHLNSLEREGLVEYYRQKSSRGRPKYIYTLKEFHLSFWGKDLNNLNGHVQLIYHL